MLNIKQYFNKYLHTNQYIYKRERLNAKIVYTILLLYRPLYIYMLLYSSDGTGGGTHFVHAHIFFNKKSIVLIQKKYETQIITGVFLWSQAKIIH